jgi:hypothetical protein
MRKSFDILSGVALFLAGMAAGVLSSTPKPQDAGKTGEGDPGAPASAVVSAEAASDTASLAERLSRLEARLDEHTAKLAEVPTTSQIVSVMEQLLAKTMTTLDDRLTTQAHSIEILKTTVSQTDSLLERVLESLDSLETAESSESGEDALFSQAV